MKVGGTTGTDQDVQFVDRDQVGFSGLDAQAFMTLLITQLQNQDPTDPMDNEQLLNQVATMRNLQSNLELGDALKAVTLNQQLTGAASFLGREITGWTDDQREVTGVVDRIVLKQGAAYLGIGPDEIRIENVTQIHAIE